MMKQRYLHAIDLFGYFYCVFTYVLWALGLFHSNSYLFHVITLVAAVLPPLYHLTLFSKIKRSYDARTAYMVETTLLAMPILAVSLMTGGYASLTNVMIAILIFLSTMTGLAVPFLLVWVQMLVLLAAASGYIPLLNEKIEYGVAYFLLYSIAILVGWKLFSHSYTREDPKVEKIRKTLRVEQLQSEGIVAAIDDGVCIINQDGIVKHVNANFLQYVNSREDEFMNRHYTYPIAVNKRVKVVSSSAAQPLLSVNIAKVFETGIPIIIDQERIEYTDGSRSFDLTISLLPLKNESGTVSAIMLTCHDISELIHIQRLKDEFVATASHELRTPATAVNGYIDLLLSAKSTGLNEEQLHYLSETKVSMSQLTSLINDMIDMSSLEAGKYENHPSPVQIQLLIQKIIDTTRAAYPQKYVTVTPDVSIATAMVDEQRLEKVCSQLIDNAFKFAPDKGMVSVRVIASGSDLVVEIADNGLEIPEEKQPQIFEKFTKLDGTGSVVGTGLGLSISKKIVDDWGGTIKISNLESGGVVFTFTVPGAVSEATTQPSPVSNPVPAQV